MFFATTVIAVTGYMLAGWPFVDACYMVVITLFGVGYGEVQPIEDSNLKFFTIAVILVGCSSVIYFLGGLFQMFAEGEIEKVMGKHRVTSDIDNLEDHTIICGFGRVGRILGNELQQRGLSFVVIDNQQDRVDEAKSKGMLSLVGDASDDSTLEQAGIHRARTLASVLPCDASNVFITLTSRELNADLEIIARGENPKTEQKLRISGADSVVSPATIGAMRIAQLIAIPNEDTDRLQASASVS